MESSASPPRTSSAKLLVPALIGAAVAIALGAYGNAHDPTGESIFSLVLPAWLPPAHRLSGSAAFLLALPVAYHCLWALGFQDTDTRVLVHSIAGCFFFGAFAAKVVIVESRNLPGLALPVAGGALFSALVIVWLTSSLWFFREFGFPSF